MDKIYRVLYCSRNSMNGSSEHQLSEVRSILASSRKNNVAVGVTGALLFNCQMFAQVLEGPLEQVETTFERIQTDMRHSDVTVLEAGYVEFRDFPEWSMAFAGSTGSHFAEFERMETPFERSETAKQVGALLRSLVVREDSSV